MTGNCINYTHDTCQVLAAEDQGMLIHRALLLFSHSTSRHEASFSIHKSTNVSITKKRGVNHCIV